MLLESSYALLFVCCDVLALLSRRRVSGGIHAVGGSILCCAGAGGTVFLENEALDDGGALSLTSPTKVNVASVMFISNTAYRGGALYTISTKFGVEAVYQSCVFSNNYAADGGGAYFYGDPAFYLVNASIFFENHAGDNSVFYGVSAYHSMSIRRRTVDPRVIIGFWSMPLRIPYRGEPNVSKVTRLRTSIPPPSFDIENRRSSNPMSSSLA